MRASGVAGLVALAACSYDPSLPGGGAIDAPAGDARPIGQLDGECIGESGRPRVLVYTYENLWRHVSNYYARLAIYNMCETRGFTVQSTNDPRAINATRLAGVDVVVFAVTSGAGLDPLAQRDYEAFVRRGGGTVGLEAAAATEPQWPFFVDNMGAAFRGHPPGLQRGFVRIEPLAHPITAGMTDFQITEQWYTFQTRPEDVEGLDVLMTLDENTLPPDFPEEFLVGYHAIGWAHERFGGRVFYTGLGDNPDTFAQANVLEMLARAIEWTARAPVTRQ